MNNSLEPEDQPIDKTKPVVYHTRRQDVSITYEVIFVGKAIGSKHVPPLVVAAWTELLDKGWTDPATVGMYSDVEAVLARDPDGTPLGCITFRHNDWNQSTWIYTSYVRPMYRLCGVYNAMYDMVRRLAKEKGMRFIESGIHQDNTAMMTAARRNGRQDTGMVTMREALS